MITDSYFYEVKNVIDRIHTAQKEKILLSARAVAKTIEKNGIIYIFG